MATHDHNDVPPPGGLPAALCGDVSIQEKASVLFSEMTGVPHPPHANAHRSGAPAPVAGDEGFCRCLRAMDCGLTDATLADMFEKLRSFGDKNPRGLTFNDVHRMVSVYPTLFNVLAFRVMDTIMNQRQVVIIERENAILGELTVTVSELEAAMLQLREELDAKQSDLTESDAKAREMDQDVLKQRVELQSNHQDVNRAKAELNNALNLQAHSVEAESLKHQELGITAFKDRLHEARSAADEADRAVDQTTAEIDGLQARIDALRTQEYNQRQESYRARGDVDEAEAQLKEKLKDADSYARDIDRADRLVENSKRLLTELDTKEQDTANTLRQTMQALSAVSAATAQHETAARETAAYLRNRETDADQAQKNLTIQRERVELLCSANTLFNTRRREQYDKEDDLVKQEVRLREQRDCLEVKEAVLRSEIQRVVPVPSATPASPAGVGGGELHPISSVYNTATPTPSHIASTPPLLPHYPTYNTMGTAAQSSVGYSPSKPTPLPGRDSRFVATDHAGIRATS